jgi:hypothetical protein
MRFIGGLIVLSPLVLRLRAGMQGRGERHVYSIYGSQVLGVDAIIIIGSPPSLVSDLSNSRRLKEV